MSLPEFSNIQVVLVNTSHPGNIGAAARALKNMGIPNLRLVDPRDYPSDTATWRAASATDVLERAEVFPDLQTAVADCGLVIGASARSRRMPWPVLSPRQCANHVAADAGRNKVALVFGREDSGLNNEELQLCHYHVQIPANEEYSSLNLAAAVVVICYEVRVAMLDALAAGEAAQPVHSGDFYDASVEDEYWDVPKADNHQLELFYAHLEQVLTDMDFHDPKNPRLLMPRMRRLFGRIRPDAMEINILRGVLTYIDDHVKRANRNDAGDDPAA
ncbi:MAG: RNA methyltransferase [Pseudomonadota bacterium]|nr:RNA methyltransferase [Pseudomonadota bacterium]